MKKRTPLKIVGSLTNGNDSQTLDEINKKIMSSSALNGGFDTLLYKIDKIEQGQGQIVAMMDKIHDSIYDPNEGVFSKLSQYKLENSNKLNEINSNVSELKYWKDSREKDEQKDDAMLVETHRKLLDLERHVDSLSRNTTNLWSAARWLVAAIGGAIVTVAIKWFETKIH